MRSAKLTGERKAGHGTVRRRRRLDDACRADGRRGLDADHQRGVRPDVQGNIPLRRHDRAAPGRCACWRSSAHRSRTKTIRNERCAPALDMIESCGVRRQLKRSHGIDFHIRAGINTGPVIVGNVGSDLRYEYTALGDAVNVAARVQTAARAGDVLVSADDPAFHHRHVRIRGPWRSRGQGQGGAASTSIASSACARSRPTRGLGQVGLSSPMVGRSAELAALTEAFQVVRAGRGRVAVLLGEPGIGKTRLLGRVARGDRRPRATRAGCRLGRGPLRQLRPDRALPPGLRPGALDARPAPDRP